MVYKFQDFVPVISEKAFVHPQAVVIGNVIIGDDVYVGPGAVLRGDWGGIILERGVNVQENCVVHMFPGLTVTLAESAHVGHGAIIHGASLGANCLIGMNAVVMDEAYVGAESIVGALTFVKAGMQIPPRSLVVGNPARIVRQVSDAMLEWKTEGTALYQKLPLDCFDGLEACEPLREVPADRPRQQQVYKTWRQKNKN